MSVGGVSGFSGEPAVPRLEDLSVEARAAVEELQAAERAGSHSTSWIEEFVPLPSFDEDWNVRFAETRARRDGTISLGDVQNLGREALDGGQITPEEREVLVDLLTDAADLFTKDGYEALAAFLRVPVPPFRRPAPEPAGSADAVAPQPAFDPRAMPVIRLGARGAAVETLQRALNRWRSDQGLPALSVDGEFGSGTRRAVMAFQRARGLGADGVVGERTWRALHDVSPLPSGGSRSRAPETITAISPISPTPRTEAIAGHWTSVPGQTNVSTMTPNGGRPVVVHTGPGFDPQKPAHVVTFLHGHRWNVGARLEQEGVLDRVRALQERDPQAIFVFPQADRAPFTYWLRPPSESLRGITRDAVGIAARLHGVRSLVVDRRTVDAHSGAGLAVVNAARAGELVADKINLLDAAYGSWAQQTARWALRQDPPPRIESWYTLHASQARNNAAMRRIAPGLVTTHQVASGVRHNGVPGRYFGTP